MKIGTAAILGTVALAALSGCEKREKVAAAPSRVEGTAIAVRDSVVPSVFEATGTASPRLVADLSTRLMGTVLSVSVQEGAHVRAGQVLLHVDGSDLAARSEGVASGLEAAKAQLALAEVQARRMRSLVADSAAPRSALDQAEAELDRARAGWVQAKSQGAELRTNQGYARIVAPFAGRVVSRLVDPGMMAAPGAALLRVEDASVLRIAATTSTTSAQGLVAGKRLRARVDGHDVEAVVEGVVPSGTGNLTIVNALVQNSRDSIPSGAVATLLLPRGERSVRLVPASAVQCEGDLEGVWVRTAQGDLRRWIRTGSSYGADLEVLSGLESADTVLVPNSSNGRN